MRKHDAICVPYGCVICGGMVVPVEFLKKLKGQTDEAQ